MLRATQYLPDIVNLQQQMYQLCHRKFDIKDATKLTVGDYINSLGQKKGYPPKAIILMLTLKYLLEQVFIIKMRKI